MAATAAETTASQTDANTIITVHVRSLDGNKFDVLPSITDTVADVKELVQEAQGILPDLQQLVLGRKMLESHATLKEIPVTDGATLTLLQLDNVPDMTDWEPRYEKWTSSFALDRASALHTAAGQNNLRTLLSLLEDGAVVDDTSERGETPLHHASRLGCLDTAMALLETGADLEARNSYKNTVLMYACFRHPYDEAVNHTTWNLFHHDDADAYVQNVSAAQQNKRAMLILLILGGADVQAKCYYDQTPYDKMKNYMNDKVAMAILENCSAIYEDGLTSQEGMSALLERNPELKPAMPAFKLLLQRRGDSGFKWAGRMYVKRTVADVLPEGGAQNFEDSSS